MVAASHKTGKLQCYRTQQYSVCSNTISLNFSETAPPPLLLLTIIIIIIIIPLHLGMPYSDEERIFNET